MWPGSLETVKNDKLRPLFQRIEMKKNLWFVWLLRLANPMVYHKKRYSKNPIGNKKFSLFIFSQTSQRKPIFFLIWYLNIMPMPLCYFVNAGIGLLINGRATWRRLASLINLCATDLCNCKLEIIAFRWHQVSVESLVIPFSHFRKWGNIRKSLKLIGDVSWCPLFLSKTKLI